MDEIIFRTSVAICKVVQEATSYLEIFNYSDPKYNMLEEHPLLPEEFDNFLHQKGAFAPRDLPEGVQLVSGMRLVLQLNAKHPETFAHRYISLPNGQYEDMVQAMRLPFNAIEGTSAVGPLFWAAIDQADDDPHLQIIFRKSDVRKRGLTRGWELVLSHSFRTNITMGFAKGTPSSDMVQHIRDLHACAHQIRHPLLLPLLILSRDLSSDTDQKQRETREWLRSLEHAISMRSMMTDEESKYVRESIVDVDEINRDLVECYARVLWKRPPAYLEVIKAIESAMARFWGRAAGNPAYGGAGGEVDKLHHSFLARLEFYATRLKGMENYAQVTIDRLTNQRSALINIIAQKDSKLALQMAGEQRRVAHMAGRENTSMISLFGAIFLPATYLASIFSMSFFDFKPSDNNSNNNSTSPGGDLSSYVSPHLWIYFAVMLPATLFLVVWWKWWDRRREKCYAQEDADIEEGIERMEAEIMATMRKRTMNKARVWG
ncbi:hypothetical protein C8A05DRAFT_38361 [Staphylotrichum tortipilum]|uniref:Uncharacterized protein n=1 Tax=Staphylotrichum tortipilum TaxID=2831512 RepID=A0AAN6MD14_9PEZI|nr:hypothetical protein C8A05DRAFT_38361 [Staphylotrichum longicolle]